MRSILLLLSRNGRRWLCAAAIAFAWLGMCQPAAAAVSCSGSTLGIVVIYSGAAISDARMMFPFGCSGLPTGGNSNQYLICTTSDAATSSGSGGTSVSPYRVAKSAAGNTLNYQLSTAGTSSTNITSSNLIIFAASFASSISGNSTFAQLGVNVPASQSVPAGDYVSTVPITVDFRTAQQSSALTSCAQGTSAGTSTLNLMVTIRVGGAACAFSGGAWGLTFGDISVTGGAVAQIGPITGSIVSLYVICSPGTAWSITFSDGNNPLGTGDDRRRMVNGNSYLNYGLYNSSNVALVDSTGTTNTGQGVPQAVNLRIKLPAQTPASLTPGLYTDNVIMSLNY